MHRNTKAAALSGRRIPVPIFSVPSSVPYPFPLSGQSVIREAVSDNVKWEEYGYELAGSCENGKEALEFIEKNPVDVVLTDICMPYAVFPFIRIPKRKILHFILPFHPGLKKPPGL